MACSGIIIQLMYSRKLPTKVEAYAATPLTQKRGQNKSRQLLKHQPHPPTRQIVQQGGDQPPGG